jgi:hypothetical protein
VTEQAGRVCSMRSQPAWLLLVALCLMTLIFFLERGETRGTVENQTGLHVSFIHLHLLSDLLPVPA